MVSLTITINDAAVAAVQEALYLLRQDDTITASSFSDGTAFGGKIAAALQSAANEIANAFVWYNAPTEDISAWTKPCRNALVYCIARELAIPVAGRIEDMKTLDQLYGGKMGIAEMCDYEDGKSAVTDADTNEVLALISTDTTAGDTKMPRSIVSVTSRIALMKDSARKDVLLAQDWNFAKVVEEVGVTAPSLEGPYPFVTDVPYGALRLVSVLDFRDLPNEWKVEDGLIKAKRPIKSVRFTKDVTDFTRWSAFARNAYVHRLAADVARTVMNNAQDAALQEQAYNLALENARLRDTRESNTPTDAWGENFYAEEMRGRAPRRREPWER